MDAPNKSKSRRQEIRKNRPDANWPCWQELKTRGVPQALGVAAAFFVLAAAVMQMRQDVVPYRSGQPLAHDIVSRVKFEYFDKNKLEQAHRQAREREPRVFAADETVWDELEKDLLSLPERLPERAGGGPAAAAAADTQPASALRAVFADAGSQSALRYAGSPEGRPAYRQSVEAFVQAVRDHRNKASNHPLVLLAADERLEDLTLRRNLRAGPGLVVDPRTTYAVGGTDEDARELAAVLQPLAEQSFPLALQAKVARYVAGRLRPTHRFDLAATTTARNRAAEAVPWSAGGRVVQPNEILVFRAKEYLDEKDVSILRTENAAYIAMLKGSRWKPTVGVLAVTLIVTVVLSAYVVAFQPRAARNVARAGAIGALMLAMLLLAALAGVGSYPIYLFGAAPTLLVAMILSIAYDRRFAIGVASLHALLVTIALDQSAPFFLVLWVGVLTAGFLLDDVRTRSKLVEVGGAAALAMMFATGAAGLLALESSRFVFTNVLYAGAAGLAAGFVVLGILPFIEKAFRITTSMTLLELADASQPLLRRLQVEAPGTYNHSLQVANLSEAAADAIGANSLLCRVAAYYHDVGKINKPDYFVENQVDGRNRHINLDPNLSLLIIVGHVKDGVELAREYNLPTSIVPFIQQHHGTTVVEYFYRRACTQQEQRDPSMAVSETQFRYPGPRPRTKEVAIVMLSDAVESATRALDDPTAAQIEGLVHDLSMRRLLDKQFDECDLTLKELEQIKRSLVKTLAGIYHGRIPYPSQQTSAAVAAPPDTTQATTAAFRSGTGG